MDDAALILVYPIENFPQIDRCMQNASLTHTVTSSLSLHSLHHLIDNSHHFAFNFAKKGPHPIGQLVQRQGGGRFG